MKIIRCALPGLLILLLTGSGCSREEIFEIMGKWAFRTGTQQHYVFNFTGTREAGTLTEADPQSGSGTYEVSGKEIVFHYYSTNIGGKNCHFSGSFVSEDKIMGNMDFIAPYSPFEWELDVEGNRQ